MYKYIYKPTHNRQIPRMSYLTVWQSSKRHTDKFAKLTKHLEKKTNRWSQDAPVAVEARLASPILGLVVGHLECRNPVNENTG